MTSLLPIVKDILPIIMPGAVHVTKSEDIKESTGQTEGMIRKGAIVDKSDKLCASGTTPCFNLSSSLVVVGCPRLLSSFFAVFYPSRGATKAQNGTMGIHGTSSMSSLHKDGHRSCSA